MMITSSSLKLIFKGRLEFGNQRSFDMVLRHWENRVETYFKSDILFKPEQVFDTESFTLTVPTGSLMGSEKQWRSTTALLNELSQFAVAGSISAWCLDNGHLIASLLIEPVSDKAAVAEFRRGCALAVQAGQESEATEALSRAIQKYEKHALAYERRGYINYKLKNFNDALYDFDRSIGLNPDNPEPYYSRGKVKMIKNDWEGAGLDFEQAIKRSLALQPVYWLARLKKGECLFYLKQYAEAIKELQMFVRRSFDPQDPNFRRRHRAYIQIGKSMLALNDVDGALDAFRIAHSLKADCDLSPRESRLLDHVENPDFARSLAEPSVLESEIFA